MEDRRFVEDVEELKDQSSDSYGKCKCGLTVYCWICGMLADFKMLFASKKEGSPWSWGSAFRVAGLGSSASSLNPRVMP